MDGQNYLLEYNSLHTYGRYHRVVAMHTEGGCFLVDHGSLLLVEPIVISTYLCILWYHRRSAQFLREELYRRSGSRMVEHPAHVAVTEYNKYSTIGSGSRSSSSCG